MGLVVYFFFSSRRRHTRYWRDWSSDVCSSDLAPDDDGAHLRVLEAQALDGVRKLDVHAEVVRVELELVALAQRLVLLHVHRERGDRPLDLKLPVPVTLRRGLEIDCSAQVNSHRRKFFAGAKPELY